MIFYMCIWLNKVKCYGAGLISGIPTTSYLMYIYLFLIKSVFIVNNY